jgi:hypothetical protein
MHDRDRRSYSLYAGRLLLLPDLNGSIFYLYRMACSHFAAFRQELMLFSLTALAGMMRSAAPAQLDCGRRNSTVGRSSELQYENHNLTEH